MDISYSQARQRFRESATRAGWHLGEHPVAGTTPEGTQLTIDVARSATSETAPVLVVSSGLHGVEGPLGSAIQTALIERWSSTSGTARVRGVFIHALNPFGFAWSRRVDGENVDLNRNFFDDPGGYSGCADVYRRIDPLLNPKRPPSPDTFALRAVWALARYGREALTAAVATGQYEFPQGLFFGGRRQSASLAIVQQHMRNWAPGAERVVHFDVHTGLGAWADCKLLVDYELEPGARDRLVRWFGESSLHGETPDRLEYQARGSFGPWTIKQRFADDYTFAFMEFGTYGSLKVLAGLRAENQAHHWGDPDAKATRAAKARLRELFCPRSEEWRARTVERGIEIARRAIVGLNES